jgi:hypothetical protein
MVDVTALHIHYVDFNRKKKIKVVKPSQPDDKLAIQQDVGEAVKKLRDTGNYEYYYVVVEIDRGGKPAYRTVIPKTLF